MRQKGAYVNLTQRPLTTAMLWAFVEGSELAPLIPHGDGSTDPTDLDVGPRRRRPAPAERAYRPARQRDRRANREGCREDARRLEAAADHDRQGHRRLRASR